VDSGCPLDRKVNSNSRPISIVVPTYRRDSVLIATIGHLLELDPAPAEILVVDQTERHQEIVEHTLRNWEAAGAIRLVRLVEPSITRAMNRGLCEAAQTFVLFVDDDIIPEPGLLEMHWCALERTFRNAEASISPQCKRDGYVSLWAVISQCAAKSPLNWADLTSNL